jgi:hypothetical protein
MRGSACRRRSSRPSGAWKPPTAASRATKTWCESLATLAPGPAPRLGGASWSPPLANDRPAATPSAPRL